MKFIVTARIFIDVEDAAAAEIQVQAALDNMVGGDVDLTEVIRVEKEDD